MRWSRAPASGSARIRPSPVPDTACSLHTRALSLELYAGGIRPAPVSHGAPGTAPDDRPRSNPPIHPPVRPSTRLFACPPICLLPAWAPPMDGPRLLSTCATIHPPIRSSLYPLMPPVLLSASPPVCLPIRRYACLGMDTFPCYPSAHPPAWQAGGRADRRENRARVSIFDRVHKQVGACVYARV